MNTMDTNLKNENLIRNPVRPSPARGFTLIELLVVISIIAVLVAFSVVALGGVQRTKYISTARGEMALIQGALEAYKGKYGVYPPCNQNPNSIYTSGNPPTDRTRLNQLYYELTGTTQSGTGPATVFTTLVGGAVIQGSTLTSAQAQLAYGVGGFVNCTKGGGEEAVGAQNFLPDIKSRQYNDNASNNTVRTTILVTSVGGPDVNYQPLGTQDMNPFRYVYPGVNNPGGYDLWVQLVIKGKTNLVCNWNKNVQINTAYP
jgi:prepilin-type N-terminal cleavage/methylation domain-containing protein